MDSRDSKKQERLEKLSRMHGGIWDCTRCFMCVEACPKDVLPMDAIMELRTEAMGAELTAFLSGESSLGMGDSGPILR